MMVFFHTELNAQAQGWSWAKRVGGTGDDQPKSIVTDANGNVYCIGDFENTVDFDPGPGVVNLTAAVTDIFISKWDSAGNFIWVKQIGGDDHDYATALGLDPSGNLIATGMFADTVDFDPGNGVYNLVTTGYALNAFMLKLDSAGNFIWANRVNFFHNALRDRSMVISPDGSICITGWMDILPVDMDPGPGTSLLYTNGLKDAVVAKYSSTGNYEWAVNFGGSLQNDAAFLASTNNTLPGAVYAGGQFFGSFDFDPGANSFIMTSAGNQDIYLVSYDAAGTFLWGKRFGGPGTEYLNSINTDLNTGDIYLTGAFAGTVDFDPDPLVTYNLVGSSLFSDVFVVKLDPLGNFIWAKSFGNFDNEEGLFVTLDPLGNVFVGGYFSGVTDFDPSAATAIDTCSSGYDLYISKFDSYGNFLWVKTAEGVLYEMITTINIDQALNIYVGGTFDGASLLMAPYNLLNAGPDYERDLFIAKIPDVSTGIPSINSESSCYLYPNPAADFTTLYLPEGKRCYSRVQICDVGGQILKEVNGEFVGRLKLDVGELKSGVYFVKIASEGDLTVKKLIVLN
jgi:hypothetical protein